MAYQNKFKRYELKFLLSPAQYAAVLNALNENGFRLDDFGKTLICNVYYDTPDFLLIRKSLEKPVYKEKLRLRAYVPQENGRSGVFKNDKVFLELKKKFNKIVYKRREALTPYEAENYFCAGDARFNLTSKGDNQTQITAEIKQFIKFYENLKPSMYISYMRKAYFSEKDADLRITFDYNALWRDYDVDLTRGSYGFSILPPEKILLEVKTSSGLPLWLVKVFSENKIYKTSFSKYGAAYVKMKDKLNKGEVLYG